MLRFLIMHEPATYPPWKIRQLLRQRRVTQKQLARRIGWSEAMVSMVLKRQVTSRVLLQAATRWLQQQSP